MDRGWKIHRIWSTDWFHRPEEQLKKALATLEKVRLNEGESTEVQVRPPAPIDEANERDQVDVEITPGPGSVAYPEESFLIPVSTPIPDTPLRMRMEILVRVVEIEGPVHRDDVARRMLTLWGQPRLGSRIAEAIEQTRSAAIDHGMIADDGSGFLALVGAGGKCRRRDRSNVASSTLRKPEFLPPAEVRQAIQQIVSREIGISPSEVGLTRYLGLASCTASFRETTSREMGLLFEQGKIMNRNGRLFIAHDSGA